MITIALLALIAIFEGLRMYWTYRPVSKKDHFKQKLEGTTKMIWDMEFKRHKTRELREGVRQDYDGAKNKLFQIEEGLKGNPDKETKDKLEDAKPLAERDLKRFEAQLKMLDLEIEGSKPTNEYPDGVNGVDHQIDSLHSLTKMLKDYITTL